LVTTVTTEVEEETSPGPIGERLNFHISTNILVAPSSTILRMLDFRLAPRAAPFSFG
jgi:hypothetical protein